MKSFWKRLTFGNKDSCLTRRPKNAEASRAEFSTALEASMFLGLRGANAMGESGKILLFLVYYHKIQLNCNMS